MKSAQREKGKIKLGRYFQELEEGEMIAVTKQKNFNPGVPRQINGRVGRIEGKMGEFKIVKIKGKNEKKFLIHPVHLKKIGEKRE